MPSRGLLAQIRSFDAVFWICIWMELMERMAYYGVRLVVPVYMVLAPSEGGPGLSHTEKGTILAAWAAMQSWLPTFSGGLSDRYGYKRTLFAAVVLKSSGYALMAMAEGFWPMLLGTQVLAAGTGIFKPGIQGTMAHGIARTGNASLGWGLFYQSVNVGSFFAAYIPAFTRDVYGWPSVFAACSVLVLLNLVPLFFYNDPVDERATAPDRRSAVALVKESVTELFTSPVLMGFVFISAGFWFAFHQFFDMLPNFVDDWVDSSGLRASAGAALGWTSWVEGGRAGANIPQEQLLNLNGFLIMTTMFLVAWASSRLRVVTSIVLGWAVATASLVLLVGYADVGVLLVAIAGFTVGEMLSSPKKQEFMAMLAPPGKRALYLGYANMPDGIGWVLGSLIAGGTYEVAGDKVNLTRDFLAEHADEGDVSAWLATASDLSEAQRREVGLRTGTTFEASLDALRLKAGEDAVAAWAELLPRGAVLDVAVAAVPALPDGVATTHASLRDHLWHTRNPGQVWWVFIGVSGVATLGMAAFGLWARSRLPA
jgi:dipeptide/tripeptide permease